MSRHFTVVNTSKLSCGVWHVLVQFDNFELFFYIQNELQQWFGSNERDSPYNFPYTLSVAEIYFLTSLTLFVHTYSVDMSYEDHEVWSVFNHRNE